MLEAKNVFQAGGKKKKSNSLLGSIVELLDQAWSFHDYSFFRAYNVPLNIMVDNETDSGHWKPLSMTYMTQ